MTTPIKSMLVADPSSLTQLRRDAATPDAKALKDTAKQFESLLTKMMLKSMRDANKGFGNDLFGSEQQDLYQDMFDNQLSLQLSNGRGLGLSDLLAQQLSRSSLAAGVKPAAAPAAAPSAMTTAVQQTSAVVAKPPTSKADFVRSMLPLARQAGQQLGVDPHALVAQAALETGWGKSVPSTTNGQSSFNLFGIKAGASWSGAAVNVPTLEFEDGVAVRKVERFRSYESPAASFNDYAGLIRNNPRYADAVGNGENVAAFAEALQQGGYATDPAYAEKMTAVAQEVRGIAARETLKSSHEQPLHRMERKS